MPLKLAAGIALAGMLLSACGGASNSPAAGGSASRPAASAASGSAAPTAADSLTFVVPTFGLETFDPSQTSTVFSDPGLGAPMFESLYRLFPPTAAVQPFLVQSGTMAP
ncbi:MAG: hypothetical protein KGJ86_19350, partial [Chloroflexota bacterium]|nr:hypothetical protein [Chloroflexota bacterium]